MDGVSLSVDAGTVTTTAVVSWPGHLTMPLSIDGRPDLPSTVRVLPDGTVRTGSDATRHTGDTDGGICVAAPIAILATGAIRVGDRDIDPVDVFAAVLRRLGAEVAAAVGQPVTRLVLAVPAGWGPRRHSLLRTAADRAGLPPPTLLAAPVAAAIHASRTSAAPMPLDGFVEVCDIGASSVTATVLQRRTDTDWDVLSTIASPDGGTDSLDRSIAAHLTGPATVTATIPDPPVDSAQPGPDLTAIRQARRTLADLDQVTITTARNAHNLTRDTVTDLSTPVLTAIAATAGNAVEAADINTTDLVAVVIVGGGAHLPNIDTTLTRRLGVTATVVTRPEQAVALGAAHTDPPPTDRTVWAATQAPDMRLRQMLVILIAGAASLGLLFHAMTSAYLHTVGGYVNYILFANGEYATACLLVMVTALASARTIALIDIQHAAEKPTYSARPGRRFFAAAGIGIIIVCMYALLTAVYLHQPADRYLTTGLKTAIPLAAITAAIAVITPRLGYLGAGAYNRLRQPPVAIALAATGLALMQYAYNVSASADTIELLSRTGGALVGAGCAWTLTRHRTPRLIAVPLLAAAGALAATYNTENIYGYAYIACVYWWWLHHTAALATDAYPQLRTFVRSRRSTSTPSSPDTAGAGNPVAPTARVAPAVPVRPAAITVEARHGGHAADPTPAEAPPP